MDLTTEDLQEIIVSETILTPEEITAPDAIQVFLPIIIGLFWCKFSLFTLIILPVWNWTLVDILTLS